MLFRSYLLSPLHASSEVLPRPAAWPCACRTRRRAYSHSQTQNPPLFLLRWAVHPYPPEAEILSLLSSLPPGRSDRIYRIFFRNRFLFLVNDSFSLQPAYHDIFFFLFVHNLKTGFLIHSDCIIAFLYRQRNLSISIPF